MATRRESLRCPIHRDRVLVRGEQELVEDANGDRWVVYSERCPIDDCKHRHMSPWRPPSARQLQTWDWLKAQQGNRVAGTITTTAYSVGLKPPAPPDAPLPPPQKHHPTRNDVFRECVRLGLSEEQLEQALLELEKLPAGERR